MKYAWYGFGNGNLPIDVTSTTIFMKFHFVGFTRVICIEMRVHLIDQGCRHILGLIWRHLQLHDDWELKGG